MQFVNEEVTDTREEETYHHIAKKAVERHDNKLEFLVF